jgi:hypothetical protein
MEWKEKSEEEQHEFEKKLEIIQMFIEASSSYDVTPPNTEHPEGIDPLEDRHSAHKIPQRGVAVPHQVICDGAALRQY